MPDTPDTDEPDETIPPKPELNTEDSDITVKPDAESKPKGKSNNEKSTRKTIQPKSEKQPTAPKKHYKVNSAINTPEKNKIIATNTKIELPQTGNSENRNTNLIAGILLSLGTGILSSLGFKKRKHN
ncbi:LPXTG cell wall anchor domain-containing protein [Lactobacillus gallinarum]|uniref:LPXTG cell wall anchor domain-containing protein n=1 Tax=Lactobacillus gallinarum TaxID=52242 RepID=UPI001749D041|nr:LPXTG cell wall anchor domain-containing protein [Lactobacillus gallinarum]